MHEDHIEALKDEPEYVRKRYRAVARTLAPGPFAILRRAAAEMIGRSLRHFFRILDRFKEEADPPVVGTIYVRQSAFDHRPDRIEVMIRALD